MNGERDALSMPQHRMDYFSFASIIILQLHQAILSFNLSNIREHTTVVTSKICGLLATINYQDYLVLLLIEYGALVE